MFEEDFGGVLMASTVLKHISSVFLGGFFLMVGIQHFTDPVWFEPIVPSILGSPRFWVYASGVFEIGLGAALIIPQTRKWGGLSLAIFLVIIYWANLNMWVNDIAIGGNKLSTLGHIVRGFAQLLMIGVALWVGGWINKKNIED
tara:strand:+ start:149 stop:580 length:432 start_codon:yes stop_codon:yes gene_type:complete